MIVCSFVQVIVSTRRRRRAAVIISAPDPQISIPTPATAEVLLEAAIIGGSLHLKSRLCVLNDFPAFSKKGRMPHAVTPEQQVSNEKNHICFTHSRLRTIRFSSCRMDRHVDCNSLFACLLLLLLLLLLLCTLRTWRVRNSGIAMLCPATIC